MYDYKHYRYPRSLRETRNLPSQHTFESRFPRTQRDAGWGEWDDKTDGSGWPAALAWGIVGSIMLGCFLMLALGWTA